MSSSRTFSPNHQTWRFLPLIEAEGAIQMAIDGWLLKEHRQGKQPPSLRFYTWHPAAISLGYHQHRYPRFWEELTWQEKPVELVRRPTGGRAVLHQGDLTYMVVTSGMVGKRVQAYEKICQFLIEGWRSLGGELHYGGAGRGYIHQANCFATATAADLIDSAGNKRIGSAQLRKGEAILQHGSILLSPDPVLFEQVFGKLPPPPETRARQIIVEALTQAARNCFGIEFISQPLSTAEWEEIIAIDLKSKEPEYPHNQASGAVDSDLGCSGQSD
jgi:lipoate-protein ligase A